MGLKFTDIRGPVECPSMTPFCSVMVGIQGIIEGSWGAVGKVQGCRVQGLRDCSVRPEITEGLESGRWLWALGSPA